MYRIISWSVIAHCLSFGQCTINVDKDFACAAGISTILPINIGLPEDTFIPQIPSGVNVCDASCGEPANCTYNWADSLGAFPFLLYRCNCPSTGPPPTMTYQGYLNISCDDVTNQKSRCICPYGKTALQCALLVLPVSSPYYCVCSSGQREDS